MKTFSQTILSAIIATVLFGCGSPSVDGKETKQKRAFVVIEDNSGSAIQNNSETAKELEWVKRYLTDHREPQDIHLLLLNGASGSAVNCHTFHWNEDSKQQEDGYVSESDRMLKDQAQKSSDRSQFKKLESQLLKALLEQNKNERSNQTCIIEIMPQLDRIIKEYGSVDVLILSDCIQESKIRTFVNPPATKKEAEAMARTDSKQIRSSFTLTDRVLENVSSVTVLVPASSNDKDLTIIPYYYSAFFADFGFHGDIKWHSLDF